MKTFESSTVTDHEGGRIDAIDMVTFAFDSAVLHFAIGVKGTFVWDDPDLGEMEIIGAGLLMKLDLPAAALGPQSQAITATLFETYLAEGSDIPVNVFEDDVRSSIDDEEWEGRTAVLSILWLNPDGVIVEREQVAVRYIDRMYVERDAAGNLMRIAVLEEEDITQRDIEAKTANKASQRLIDATDNSFRHVGTARTQKINFGQRPEEKVKK